MTERVLGPSGSKGRRRRLFVLAALMGAVFTVFFVAASSANLSPSTFGGGDGNLTCNDANGATDWNCLTNTPGGIRNVGIDDPSGSGDNSFGQGTKEDDANATVVSGSIPPQKSDLIRFYEASELVNNNVYLYLAWERTNVLGSANMDFEINKNATAGFTGSTLGAVTLNRTNGDILVTFDFGGSGAPVLGILRWLTTTGTNPYDGTPNVSADCFSANKLPCWGDHLDLNSTNSEGAVNAATVNDNVPPDNPRNLLAGTFGEAAINLTGAGVITSENGCDFGSATTFLKSRSSSSFPSEVKDFVAPIATPVVSNCGAFKIIKKSSKTNNGLANATFTVSGVSGTKTTDSNGEICLTGLALGSYTVTETGAPSGYAIDDTDPNTAGNQTTKSVTVGGGDTCASKTVTFTDTPLSKIQVKYFRQGTQTETKASIVCASGSTIAADSENGDADPAFDDTDESFSNLAPGTFTCTVVVDP